MKESPPESGLSFLLARFFQQQPERRQDFLNDRVVAFKRGECMGSGLDSRNAFLSRFLPQISVERNRGWLQNQATAFQHPGIAPPQRFGLLPCAVEQNNSLDILENSLILGRAALAVQNGQRCGW